MKVASPRRLLIVIYSMSGGGAERVTANLANYWALRGWEIMVVTLASDRLDYYELHPTIKRVYLDLAGESANLPVALWQNFRRVAALRRVLRKFEPDVALGMMTAANVLLALASLGSRVPTVGSEHVHPPAFPIGRAWEQLRRSTYGLLQAVVSLTTETAEWLKANTGARNITVIPNAAPWPLPVQSPVIKPNEVCPRGRHMLLAVGRLEYEKGFDLLLEAFAPLARKYPDWDLAILGEGSLRSSLDGNVRTARLRDRVFLPGHVGNLLDWFERAEIYVMSSRCEGFGNTLAEALAHAVPAVSFDCPSGPRHIIRHNVDGLLVPVGDLPSLKGALDRLMSDSALRQRFSARAVEARNRFSLERIANLWEGLFEEVLLERSLRR